MNILAVDLKIQHATLKPEIDRAIQGVIDSASFVLGPGVEAFEEAFAAYQVNSALMASAPDDCRFMHDLPARRGLEVTDEVIDGPQSVVFDEAENRLHAQKGVLLYCLNGLPS